MTRLLISRIERAEHRQRQMQRGGGSPLPSREPRAEGDFPHRPYWRWQWTVKDACIIAGHLGGWKPGMAPVETLETGLTVASLRPSLAWLGLSAKAMQYDPARVRKELVSAALREAIMIADVGPPKTVLGRDIDERAFVAIPGHRQLAETMTSALLSHPAPDAWGWHDWSREGYADPQAAPLAATAAAVAEIASLSGHGLEYGMIEQYAPAATSPARLWADLDAAASMKAEHLQLTRDLDRLKLEAKAEGEPPAYVAHIHPDDMSAVWVAQALNDPDRMNAAELETVMRERAWANADAMEAVQ